MPPPPSQTHAHPHQQHMQLQPIIYIPKDIYLRIHAEAEAEPTPRYPSQQRLRKSHAILFGVKEQSPAAGRAVIHVKHRSNTDINDEIRHHHSLVSACSTYLSHKGMTVVGWLATIPYDSSSQTPLTAPQVTTLATRTAESYFSAFHSAMIRALLSNCLEFTSPPPLPPPRHPSSPVTVKPKKEDPEGDEGEKGTTNADEHRKWWNDFAEDVCTVLDDMVGLVCVKAQSAFLSFRSQYLRPKDIFHRLEHVAAMSAMYDPYPTPPVPFYTEREEDEDDDEIKHAKRETLTGSDGNVVDEVDGGNSGGDANPEHEGVDQAKRDDTKKEDRGSLPLASSRHVSVSEHHDDTQQVTTPHLTIMTKPDDDHTESDVAAVARRLLFDEPQSLSASADGEKNVDHSDVTHADPLIVVSAPSPTKTFLSPTTHTHTPTLGTVTAIPNPTTVTTTTIPLTPTNPNTNEKDASRPLKKRKSSSVAAATSSGGGGEGTGGPAASDTDGGAGEVVSPVGG
ncbi:hypothetical protein HK102_005255, partial [Quaeritorhiza haematococci]